MDYHDRRIKGVDSMMVSGGFRLGSWEYLKWRHIKPIERDGITVAAKIYKNMSIANKFNPFRS